MEPETWTKVNQKPKKLTTKSSDQVSILTRNSPNKVILKTYWNGFDDQGKEMWFNESESGEITRFRKIQ